MRLELLVQNIILHTKREFLLSEAKAFMKLLKTRKNVASLIQNCQLYSNLYVTCQGREDLEE